MPSRLMLLRLDQPVREQVQAQVGVGRVRGCLVEVDLGEHDLLLGAAVGVGAGRGDVEQRLVRVRDVAEVLRRGSEGRRREPDVQHGGVTVAGGDRGDAVTIGGAGVCGHSGRSGFSHAPKSIDGARRPRNRDSPTGAPADKVGR